MDDSIICQLAADISQEKPENILLSLGVTRKRTLEEMILIAFSDIADHVTIDEGGAIQAVALQDMGAKSKVVKKVKEKTTISESKDGETIFKNSQVEYELYDKADMLKFIAGLQGMKPVDKLDVTHGIGSTVSDHVKTIVKDIAAYADKE